MSSRVSDSQSNSSSSADASQSTSTMNHFFTWLTCLASVAIASDMYSSVAQLGNVYLVEEQVANKLEEYLNVVKSQTDIVDQ